MKALLTLVIVGLAGGLVYSNTPKTKPLPNIEYIKSVPLTSEIPTENPGLETTPYKPHKETSKTDLPTLPQRKPLGHAPPITGNDGLALGYINSLTDKGWTGQSEEVEKFDRNNPIEWQKPKARPKRKVRRTVKRRYKARRRRVSRKRRYRRRRRGFWFW